MLRGSFALHIHFGNKELYIMIEIELLKLCAVKSYLKYWCFENELIDWKESILHLFSFTTFSGNQSFSVFVQVQFGNDNFGWVNVDWDRSTVRFFFGDFVDLDSKFQSVNRRNFTFFTFFGTSDNQDFVFFSDWQSFDTVLSSQFFG